MTKQIPKQISEMTDEELANYKEPGAESEGEFDVVRPYKKKLTDELDESGHTLLSQVLQVAIPNSPLEVRPSVRSNVVSAAKKAGNSVFDKFRKARGVDETGGHSLDYSAMPPAPIKSPALPGQPLDYSKMPPPSSPIKTQAGPPLDYAKMSTPKPKNAPWKQRLIDEGKLKDE